MKRTLKKKVLSSFKESQMPSERQSATYADAQKGHLRIVIVNQHGCNRGDEAALKGMLYGLKKLLPGGEFSVFTRTPAQDFQHIDEARFYDTVHLETHKKAKILYYTLGGLLHRLGLRKLSRKLFRIKAPFLQCLKEADLVISAPGGAYIGDLYERNESTCIFPIYPSCWASR